MPMTNVGGVIRGPMSKGRSRKRAEERDPWLPYKDELDSRFRTSNSSVAFLIPSLIITMSFAINRAPRSARATIDIDRTNTVISRLDSQIHTVSRIGTEPESYPSHYQVSRN